MPDTTPEADGSRVVRVIASDRLPASLPLEPESVPVDHHPVLPEPKFILTEHYTILTEPKFIPTEHYTILSERNSLSRERLHVPAETKIAPAE